MNENVQRKRLAVACLLVAGLVMAVPVSGVIVGATDARAQEAASAGVRAGIDAQGLLGDHDPQTALARIEQAAHANEATLPRAFETEVGLPQGGRDARVNDDGTVIGCVLDVDAETAIAAVRAQMKSRGFNEVPLGALQGSTFVKRSGACRWLLVTCTQVGGATNVVYRTTGAA